MAENIMTNYDWYRQFESELWNVLPRDGGIYSVEVKGLSHDFRWCWNPRQIRSASLIKIFILMTVFQQAKKQLLSWDEMLKLEDRDKVGGAGSLDKEPSGVHRSIRELSLRMMRDSDNTATNLLINRLGMELINANIVSWGMSETILQRKMMDAQAIAAGRDNFTSCRDLTKMLEMMYRGRCLGKDADSEALEIMKQCANRTKLVKYLPMEAIVAHKTGEMDNGAEHDAGIIYSPYGSAVVAVMADKLKDCSFGREMIASLGRVVWDALCRSGGVAFLR